MSYQIEVRLANKKGWHTPAEAQAYYKRYSREGITVHWWGAPSSNPDSAHDNIVNYILGKANKGTGSVNYVLSNNKITMMVAPDNVAWASQSGNPTTVSIEFSPHLNDEGYKKAGWLIKELEGRYGRGLRLYPHNHWIATQCPGSLDLNRMRREADKWKAGGYNPAPPPPPPAPAPTPPATAKLSWHKFDKVQEFVTNKQPTNLWDFNNTKWSMVSKGEFAKGHRVTVYGQVTNETLNAVYYLTEYSYTRKITNGFNQKDLDPYVEPPAPTPEPPVPPVEPEPNPEPAPPVEPDKNAIIAFLEGLVLAISEFLKKLRGGK